MAKRPALVIMAAGMGSRYGGLKQIDPVDSDGNLIIDFSIYDALEAGFEKVVFIIKRELEADFKEVIGDRISRRIKTEYVYQELEPLPAGFAVPKERQKPWGTAHAILNCRSVLDGPFAVINADDFYGKSAFASIYQELSDREGKAETEYTMVGYRLVNTLTDHGHVARGICMVDEAGGLKSIRERTRIEKHGMNAEYTEDDGLTWSVLPNETIVSMNLWGFTSRIFDELEERFAGFLKQQLNDNPLKCEYFLPNVVGDLLAEGKASVKVLNSEDCWYGVTYRPDKEKVEKAVAQMKVKGLYPEKVWEDLR